MTAPSSPATPRFCRDCAHFFAEDSLCGRVKHTDRVTGQDLTTFFSASIERTVWSAHPGYTSSDPCSPEGKHWTPKPIDLPKPIALNEAQPGRFVRWLSRWLG